ncbi:D-alanyl-D-alanine carboxypeptidase family protein [Paenibacillus sp. TAB 01]|uniref:M15 family metallopeptidase n=1 Tax=Paenibacillus sp. TAB 01 TaxID=3368988 RepID=UPI0037520FB0
MKKWFFWLVLLALAGYGAAQYEPDIRVEQPPAGTNQAGKTAPSKPGLTIKVTKDQIHQGDMLLVNNDHPGPKGVGASEAVNLFQHKELVQGFGLLDHSIRLSPRLVQKFSAMIGAAEKDGVRHFLISSGYRDAKEQDLLYRQMGGEYAMPAGYSEHNLGLSLDIGSTQSEMNQAPEGKWLKANAWRYGFILRYPKDKTAVTGIQYEPWHFRYVGLPHSAVMHEKGWVLEEYLDFLQEQKSFTTVVGNQTYDIFYYPISGDTTLQVPASGRYDISGSNTDGVIVTVYR